MGGFISDHACTKENQKVRCDLAQAQDELSKPKSPSKGQLVLVRFSVL